MVVSGAGLLAMPWKPAIGRLRLHYQTSERSAAAGTGGRERIGEDTSAIGESHAYQEHLEELVEERMHELEQANLHLSTSMHACVKSIKPTVV